MKLAHYLGVTLCFGLVLPLAQGQVATNCVPTKNQVVLRQRVAELDAAEGKLDTAKFKAEITALRRQGKIDETQYASLEKVVEKAQAAKGPMATSEGRTAAYAALNAKVEELEVAQAQVPDEEAEIRGKADRALAAKMAELERTKQEAKAAAAAAAAADTEEEAARQAAAEAALADQMRQLNSQPTAAPEETSESQAKAQAALASKMAELNRAQEEKAEAEAQAQARAALAAKMAELDAQETPTAAPSTAPAPAPAPVVVAPAPAPAPVPQPTAPAPAPSPAPAPVVATVSPEGDRDAAAQNALEEKMTEMRRAENRAITGIPVQPTPARPAETLEAEQTLHRTMQAPVAAVPPASAKTGLERLQEMTELYRQNLMTPEEYHRERAKIVHSLSQ